jgi:hypothetical protein
VALAPPKRSTYKDLCGRYVTTRATENTLSNERLPLRENSSSQLFSARLSRHISGVASLAALTAATGGNATGHCAGRRIYFIKKH